MNNSTKNVIAALCFLAWTSFALAQDHQHHHDHNADPMLTQFMIDQLELRDGGSDGNHTSSLDAQAWIGKDLNKLWLKTEIEHGDGETEDAEIQALFSHGISPYWDLQAGLRQDIKPTPSRTWGVIGVHGLAPYYFNVDAALFCGDANRVAARLAAEYELLFSQKLILSPSIEVNAYGQNDIETGNGSGLADVNAGLRLRYEIRREFAPYMGIRWQKKFGNTADMAKTRQESDSNTQWVLGLHAWY